MIMMTRLTNSWIFTPRVLLAALTMLLIAFALGYLLHPM
jgi:hypothetical protein